MAEDFVILTPEELAKQGRPDDFEIVTMGEDKDQPGFVRRALRWVEGGERREFDLPEFEARGAGEAQRARVGLGITLAGTPERQAEVFRENVPEATYTEDKFGNLIGEMEFTNPEWLQFLGKPKTEVERGYINRPGISKRDVLTIAGQGLLYAGPAGRAMRASTLPRRMIRTGVAEGATSLAIDAGAEQFGAEPGGELTRAGIAGGAGATLAGLAPVVGTAWRKVMRYAPGIGGALSSTAESAAKKIGLDPSAINERLKRIIEARVEGGLDKLEEARRALFDYFNITPTLGQARDDLSQLGREDTWRQTIGGPGEVMRRADERQAGELGRAREQVQSELTGGRPIVQSESDAAARVMDRLDESSAVLRTRIDEAYNAARDVDMSVSPESSRGLLESMLTALKDARRIIGSDELTPATNDAIKRVQLLAGKDSQFKRFSLTQLDVLRQELRSTRGHAKVAGDAANIDIMVSSLDRWIDDVVDAGLYWGDSAALAQLKAARGLRREYATKYELADPSDEAGRAMQKIMGPQGVANDATTWRMEPRHVANLIIGTSELGGTRLSVAIARRVQRALGEGAEEWDNVREMAWLRLSMDDKGVPRKPEAFRDVLNRALYRSKSMMDTLFSKEEQALFKDYRTMLLMTAGTRTRTGQRSAFTFGNVIRKGLRTKGVGKRFGGDPVQAFGWQAAANAPTVIPYLAARNATRQRLTRGIRSPFLIGAGTSAATTTAPEQN